MTKKHWNNRFSTVCGSALSPAHHMYCTYHRAGWVTGVGSEAYREGLWRLVNLQGHLLRLLLLSLLSSHHISVRIHKASVSLYMIFCWAWLPKLISSEDKKKMELVRLRRTSNSRQFIVFSGRMTVIVSSQPVDGVQMERLSFSSQFTHSCHLLWWRQIESWEI